MATFARAQFLASSDGIDPATRAITPTAATSLLVAVLSERSGTGNTPHTMSDGGATGGDWVKAFGWDQQLANSSARHSFSVWWKVAGSTAAITVSGDDGTGNGKRLSVHEYTTDTAGTWSVVSGAAVGADTGAGSSSPLAIGPTGSAPAGDNLVLLSINWRTAGDQAYPGAATGGFTGLTSSGAGSDGRQHGTAWQQDAAGGTFSTSVDWTGTGHESAGGIVVFALDGGGGGSQTLTPPLLTRSKTIYTPTVTGGAEPTTITVNTLDFAEGSNIRMRMALAAGLRTGGCTIIWREKRRTQDVYSGGFVFNSGTGSWDAGAWTALFVTHGCDGTYDANGQKSATSGPGMYHEIAGMKSIPNGWDSRDFISTPSALGTQASYIVSYDVWVERAVVIKPVSTTLEHYNYVDFSDPTQVIQQNLLTSDPATPTNQYLDFGAPHWIGDGSEDFDGQVTHIKVFSRGLSTAEIRQELDNFSDTPVVSDCWYSNYSPSHTDLTDKKPSGTAHPFTWHNGTATTVTADFDLPVTDQTLSPSLLTRTKTIYSPTVSVGAVTVSPSLLTRTKVLYAPSVSVGTVNLTPPLLTRSKTLYAPVVSQAGAPQIVAPGLLTRTKVLYSPVVVPGEVDVAPPLLTRTKVLYAPTISTGYGITPPLLTRGKTLYAPTITVGGVTLAPPLLTRSKTLYFPTLTGGDTPVATGGVFWPTVRRRRR